MTDREVEEKTLTTSADQARQAALEAARDELATRRARLRELQPELSDLSKEISAKRKQLEEELKPKNDRADELVKERNTLQKEIERYSVIINSAGKKSYQEAVRGEQPGGCVG